MADPTAPQLSSTSASRVGFPLESRISRALTSAISVTPGLYFIFQSLFSKPLFSKPLSLVNFGSAALRLFFISSLLAHCFSPFGAFVQRLAMTFYSVQPFAICSLRMLTILSRHQYPSGPLAIHEALPMAKNWVRRSTPHQD
jgi:hypothetical protein